MKYIVEVNAKYLVTLGFVLTGACLLKNCRIGRVEYSGSLTVDSGAEVGEQVKTI